MSTTSTTNATPRRRGRPSTYTREVADTICARMAEGESLRSICDEPAMPSRGAVYEWVMRDEDGFSDRFARARVAQAHGEFERLRATEDAALAGEVDTKAANAVLTSMRWRISKLHPDAYADQYRVDQRVSGTVHHRHDHAHVAAVLDQLPPDQLSAVANVARMLIAAGPDQPERADRAEHPQPADPEADPPA